MKKTKSCRDKIFKYVLDKYGTQPEYLWDNTPDAAVLRHSDNRKWYGAVLTVGRDKLGLKGGGTADVLNLKCDPITGGSVKLNDGIFPGYHMNKASWISVILDGTVDSGLIEMLIDNSFELTAPKRKRKAARITEWIVPANPKYYDIEKAVSENSDGLFLWKQGRGILVGDTVYLYVAAPVSAVYCKCEVKKINIPYSYSDDNISMDKLMELKLVRRYDKEPISFAMLKDYGVTAVRGPRGIPKELVRAIEKMYHEK